MNINQIFMYMIFKIKFMQKLFMLKVYNYKSGIIKYKNGNHYEGELQYGNLHGIGKFTFTDGVVYEGEIQYNKITGKVKLNKLGQIYISKWINI